MPIRSIIGQVIRQLREEQGLTPEELASRVHIDPERLRRVEEQSVIPPLGLLMRISRALGSPWEIEEEGDNMAIGGLEGGVVRPVDARRDAEAIARIYNPYITQTTITFEVDPVDGAQMGGRILQITEEQKFPYLVYELPLGDEQKVVGYCYASAFRTRAAWRHTVEASIYLDREYAGRGIGERLYVSLMEALKDRGDIHAVMAGISLPNPESIRLHEKLGFRRVGHLREVGHKFDRWLDLEFWQLNLMSDY